MTDAAELAAKLRAVSVDHPDLQPLLEEAAEMLLSLDNDADALWYAMKEDRS